MIVVFFSTVGFVLSQSSGYEYIVTVTDPKKQPLIGVNVYTEDQSFVGVTDLDGKVALNGLAYSDVVNFSYIGFSTIQAPFYEIRKLGGIIRMQLEMDALPEIVVVGRRDEKPEDIPYELGMVSKDKIEQYNAQTTADALMQNENVFVQKSQMGGGSINIRGFEANKVLLVVDGVRMNNIVYRAGHLQDALKVDPNALEQIEVVYGPGSLNYGSDALGGVVQFRTKDPKLLSDENDTKGYRSNSGAMTRFSSANREISVHGNVNYGTPKWATFTSMTFTNYDDLRAGGRRPADYPDFGKRLFFVSDDGGIDRVISNESTPNIQRQTGYSQFDFLQKLKYKKNNNQYFHFNFQYSNSSNIPRYDFLIEEKGGEPAWSDWYYGPQQRVFFSMKSQSFKKTKFYNKMTIIGAVQRLDEDRNSRKLFNAWLTFNEEDIYVFSLTADFQKNFASNFALTYGLDGNYNRLYSTAGQLNLNTQERRGGGAIRYPDDFSAMTMVEGYANIGAQSKDSIFSVFGGMRYTFADLFARYTNRPDNAFGFPQRFYLEGLSTTNTRLTWSVGGTISTRNGWQVKASASTAFHAPNIDDFAKFRAKNGFFSVPNDTLKPERTLSTELSLGKTFGDVNSKEGKGASIDITGYYTFLKDAYRREPFTYLGDSLIQDERTGEKYRVQANVNRERGKIIGCSGNFKLKFGKYDAFSGAGYSIGRVIENGVDIGPLDHIPPLFTRAGINYTTNKFRLSAVVRHNGWKHIEDYAGGSDNPELATEDGTYAWTTYNFYSTYYINQKFSIDASVENILDFHYRPFSSGVSAPGRNFIIALRGKF